MASHSHEYANCIAILGNYHHHDDGFGCEMRNSSILKLAKKNNKLVNGTKNANGGGKEEKKWLHAPETLLAGHVVYLVKVSQSVNDR